MSCFTISAHGPVRGNRRASSGTALSRKYGNAIPTPTVVMSEAPTHRDCCDSATVNSPTNIPNVHGVERAAVRIPKRKLPTYVSCRGVKEYIEAGTFTVNRPNVLRAITTSTPMIAARNHVFWNSSPHLSHWSTTTRIESLAN